MEDKIITTKLPLIVEGIQISSDIMADLNSKFGKFYSDDYVTTSGIMLELESDGEVIYVTAHLNANSSFVLTKADEDVSNKQRYLLTHKGKVISSVNIWTPPKYSSENKIIGNTKITNLVNSHFDRIRISPINGCSVNCAFCSCREVAYSLNSIEDMDVAIDIALQDNRITHALISGGTPKEEDLPYLSKVFEHICQKYPIDFDIMMMPREFTSFTNTAKYGEYIKFLKDIGLKGLCINIELFNDDVRKKYCRGKYNLGIENYLAFLTEAVKVFGTQNVRSGLIVGLESLEDTLKGVRAICETGAMPMLSPYVKYGDIGENPTLELLIEAKEKTDIILKEFGIPLAPLCSKCRHNTI